MTTFTEHKPTFTKSEDKRPWHQRLTPVAWVLIIVSLVSCLACVGAGTYAATQEAEKPFDATATPTMTPTTGPTPTPEPSPTATEWYEGMLTETPTPTVAADYSAWWSDEMVQDEDGDWWPPEEVKQMVQDHVEASTEDIEDAVVRTTPPDLDAYEEALRAWQSGPQLEQSLTVLSKKRAGEASLRSDEWALCNYATANWSSDGLTCWFSTSCNGGTISEYDSLTGELLGQEQEFSSGTVVMDMHYDSQTGHWQSYDFVEYIP